MSALAAGEILVVEAAWIAAVSRQRVEQWCAEAKIDHKSKRRAYIKRLWAKEVRRQRMLSKGVAPQKRTKAQMRAIGDKAKAVWDGRRG